MQTGVSTTNLSSGTWWAGLGIAAGAGAAAGAAGYGAGVGIAYAVGPAFAASLGGGVLIGSGAGTASALASYSTSWMGTGLAKALGLNMSTAGYSVGGMAKAGLTGAVSGAVSGGIGSGFVGTAAGTATGVGFGYAAWGEDVSWKSAGIAFASAYSGMLMSSSLSDDTSQATARNTAGRAGSSSSRGDGPLDTYTGPDPSKDTSGWIACEPHCGDIIAEHYGRQLPADAKAANDAGRVEGIKIAAEEVVVALLVDKGLRWVARGVLAVRMALAIRAAVKLQPAWVKDAATFCAWMQNLEKGRVVLTGQQVDGLVGIARARGVEVRALANDLAGHPGTAWPTPHIHFGKADIHLAVPKGYNKPF